MVADGFDIESEMIADISNGETSRLEFEGEGPGDHERYLKTVVAFCNTAGGRMLFGVTDGRKIVGIPDENIHQVKDSVIDTIYKSCEPPIIPYTYIMTLEDRNVLVVEVSPGDECPYYIKSEGVNQGTYVRIGSTSMPASPHILKSLILRGRGYSFDMLDCPSVAIDEQSLTALCDRLSSFNRRIEPVNLENMRVIKRNEGMYVATNAYALLTSNPFPYAEVQCACFRGTDDLVFLDSQELNTDLITQVQDALSFVLRHINLSSEINGLVRKDTYEIPENAIREAIVNAVVHREYAMSDSSIFVKVYDDRIDIESPGLPLGLDVSRPDAGRSKIRNPAIASVFKAIGFIEKYGTGVRRMIAECRANHVPVPEFIEDKDYLVVRFSRKKVRSDLSDNELKTLAVISENPSISQKGISDMTNLSTATVKRITSKMQSAGIISREGNRRSGRWVINRCVRSRLVSSVSVWYQIGITHDTDDFTVSSFRVLEWRSCDSTGRRYRLRRWLRVRRYVLLGFRRRMNRIS